MSREEKIYCDCCGKEISRPKDRFDKKYSLGFQVKKTYFTKSDNFWMDGTWHPAKGYQNLELCEDCFDAIGRLVERRREAKANAKEVKAADREMIKRALNAMEEFFDKQEGSYICINLASALEQSWRLGKLHEALEKCKKQQNENLESFVFVPLDHETLLEITKKEEEE